MKEIRPVGPTQNVSLQYRAKSRWRFSAGVFCFGVLLLLSESLPARQSQSNADQQNPAADNPPARVARISYMKGTVSFWRGGVGQWSQAALNFPATTGDRIYTDHGARAELQVGPFAVRMASKTDLTITNLSDQIMQLGLQQGTLRLSIY